MGNEWKDQFSREELESMGEEPLESQHVDPGNPEPEPKPSPEPKPEPSPEPEPEGEPKGEPEPEPEPKEGEPVPYDRFAKIYGRAKQTEREKDELNEKLDLFKRNPDGYYTKYPDERPADYHPPSKQAAPAPVEILPMRQMLGAAVNDPDNPDFHGKILAELMEMGPVGIAAANDYYQEYVEDVRDQVQASKAKEDEATKTLREEDDRFLNDRATELYGKQADQLDAVQADKVEKTVQDTLIWMKTNNRMAYRLDDAWRLMNYEKTLSDAAASGAKGLVDFAKGGTVKSVATGGSKPSADPYAAYLSMSEVDLEKKIAGMPDQEYTDFLSKATTAFREKFPALPYLN